MVSEIANAINSHNATMHLHAADEVILTFIRSCCLTPYLQIAITVKLIRQISKVVKY